MRTFEEDMERAIAYHGHLAQAMPRVKGALRYVIYLV
jgi:hypothetical protein